MSLDLLWTDYCFLTVLFLSCLAVLSGLRKRHIRDSLTHLFYRPLAVSAGIVLLCFITIGVLDSIHFRDDQKGLHSSMSVLDELFYPIGSFYEKSYSAPLALKLYVTKTEMVNGVATQVYPELSYPSLRLANENERNQMIVSIVLKSFGISCAIILAFVLGGLMAGNRRIGSSGWSALITIFVLSFFIFTTYWLSRYVHVLGTGQIGEDIFYYTVKSIRTGLIIGFLTTLFMLPLALFLGISAGYFGGIVDDIIQYVYTTLSSIPGVLLITASILSLQAYFANHPEQFTTLAQRADARLLALCAILGVTSWTSLCRLLRAETLKLREIDYVTAARALGSSWFAIIRKHLLPNVMHLVIITLVLDFSFLIMAEALLSYVGVGVSSMTISWGNMINGARMELARDPIIWWPILAAFTLMFLLVLAINLFADALRDAFDPHHSHI